MAENSIERLHYYQGQYLRAQDFRDEQEYHRDMRRRHNVGPHTWGIVVGLELVEQDQEGGSGKDVYVQPGLAVDGYGREIIVSRPHKLDSSDFIRFADEDHYEVWIGYLEEEVNRVEQGYAGCDADNNRIRETFRIVVEPDDPQPDSVIVDGEAASPPVDEEDDSNIPPDLSVPFQELPAGDRSRWLIRLGNVLWDGSQFGEAADGKLSEGREYASLVGAALLAPAGELTVSDRYTQPLAAGDDGVAMKVEGSLQVERDLTAKADVHVDGGILDFRQSDGSEGGEFALFRTEGEAGDDLRIRIGEEQNGDNRLVVGPQTGETDDTFAVILAVVDDGTVGVRADDPDHALQVGDGTEAISLSIRGPDHDTEAATLAFEDDAGTNSRWIRLTYDSEANNLKVHSAEVESIAVFRRQSGRVGIGTETPNRLLTVYGEEGTYMNVIADGGDHEVLLGADSAGGIVSTMTNHDLVLRAGGNSTKVTIKTDGDVGIGTSTPNGKLQIVDGRDVDLSSDAGFLVMGEFSGLNMALDDNEIQARNGGSHSTLHLQREGGDLLIGDFRDSAKRVVMKDNGNVGVGLTNPAAKLHVMGSIRMGATGALFAPGFLQDFRVVTGSVNGNGAITNGTGFSVSRTQAGRYTVTFSASFAATPIVLAASNNTDEDHLITARSVTSSNFVVEGRDVGNFSGDLQDTAFSFLALGTP